MSARRILLAAAILVGGALGPAACTNSQAPGIPATTTASPVAADTKPATGTGQPFSVAAVARFDEPWAMTFLPDGAALVTERGGALFVVDPATGDRTRVDGTPEVVAAGQGGLGDIALSPTFATSGLVYLSWVEAGEGDTSGAVVGRARLVGGASPRLDNLSVVWRQRPKVTGDGHFGHRIAVSPDGRHLFISSGERQKMDPAQDLGGNLGEIVRLTLDGAPAPGNPFADRGGVSAEIWSLGHRNPLGLAFDAAGNLWSSEMGPLGGDEINLILPGRNYGWPRVSNGSHYSGEGIPDHRPGDGFEAPKAWWNPSISPGSLMIYSGRMFDQWRGDAFVGALSGRALMRVDLAGTVAAQGDRWDMGARIRAVEEGPDGAICLLEDGPGGLLLKLTAS